jgi:hypothetical protein
MLSISPNRQTGTNWIDSIEVRMSGPAAGVVSTNVQAGLVTNLGALVAGASPSTSYFSVGASMKKTAVDSVTVDAYGVIDTTEGQIVAAPHTFAGEVHAPWIPVFCGLLNRRFFNGGIPGPNVALVQRTVMWSVQGLIVGRRAITVDEWKLLHTTTVPENPLLRQDADRLARLVQYWSIRQGSQFLQDVEAGMDPNTMTDEDLRDRYAVPSAWTIWT